MSEREEFIENQTMELQFQEAMHKVQKQLDNGLKPKGACFNCDEPVVENQLFCDADCRDDYAKRKKAQAQRLY